MTQESVLAKVKKLLALGDEKSGAFEQEALNALSIAKKLIAQHNISEAELEIDTDQASEGYGFVDEEAMTENVSAWQLTLVSVMMNLCGVQSYRSRSRHNGKSTIHFMGKKEDVALATASLALFIELVKRRASAFCSPSENHTSYRSYAEGFSMQLLRRSREKVEMDTPEQQASLAVVEYDRDKKLQEWMREHVPGLKDGHIRNSYRGDRAAYVVGQMAASQVDLSLRHTIKGA